eukprot:TRINITY_DN1595_c0_g6_i1.p1 TRINITY_DN1595_c0_g6~~TRINITY_DN1595_c0_g6_i1.p1  ORF type:complete len:952 (+),score=413.99 TRINITY_DN1595_c0_g6_i1:166-3021(+)
MSLKDYQRVKVLGKGSFGEAVLLRARDTGKHVVVKRVNLGPLSTKEKEEAQNEVRILRRLDHPNIVRYVESFADRTQLCILMEYVDGGDLGQRIKGRQGRLMPEDQILHIFVQLCLAVKYLHDKHILHRDLKTQNIFLSSHKQQPVVKLGDFGISTALQSTLALAKTMCGTPYYFSPELCQNKPYNNKSDVWSLGCILYELCTLKHAFDGSSMQSLMKRIVRGEYKPIPADLSDNLKMLVDATLMKDVSRRPSVNRILSLRWMQERVRGFVDTPMPQRAASPAAGAAHAGNGVAGAARPRPGQRPQRGADNEKQAAPKASPQDLHDHFQKLLGRKQQPDGKGRPARSNSEPAGAAPKKDAAPRASPRKQQPKHEEDPSDARPRPASGGGDSRLDALRRQAAKHKAEVEKKLAEQAKKQPPPPPPPDPEALARDRRRREQAALAAKEEQQRRISDAQQLARKRSEQYLQERKQQEAEMRRLRDDAEDRKERLKRLQHQQRQQQRPASSGEPAYAPPPEREYLRQREEGFRLDLAPSGPPAPVPYGNMGGVGVHGVGFPQQQQQQHHAIDEHLAGLRQQMMAQEPAPSKFAVLNRLPRSPGRDGTDPSAEARAAAYENKHRPSDPFDDRRDRHGRFPAPPPPPGGVPNPDDRPLPVRHAGGAAPGGTPVADPGGRLDLDNFLDGFDDPSRTRRAAQPHRSPVRSPHDGALGGGGGGGEESAAMMLWNQRRAAIEAKRHAQNASVVANTAHGAGGAPPAPAPESEEARARRLWEERQAAYEKRRVSSPAAQYAREDDDLVQQEDHHYHHHNHNHNQQQQQQQPDDARYGGDVILDPAQEAREYEDVQSRLRRDVLDQVLMAQDADDDFFEEAPATPIPLAPPPAAAAASPPEKEPNVWAEGVIKTHLVATLGLPTFQTTFAALQNGDDRGAHAALQGHEALLPLFTQLLYFASQ